MPDSTYTAKQAENGDVNFKVVDKGDGALMPVHVEDAQQRAEMLLALTAIANAASQTMTAVQALQTAMIPALADIRNALNGATPGGGSEQPPPVGGLAPDWSLNAVTSAATGAAFTDLAEANPAQRERANADGSTVVFPPNALQKTDVGIWVDGNEVRYVLKRSRTPINWVIRPGLEWAAPSITAAPNGFGDVDSPAPVILQTNNSDADFWPAKDGLDGYAGLTEAIPAGTDIVVHARFKAAGVNGEGLHSGALIKLEWDGGSENLYIGRIDAAPYVFDIRATSTFADPFDSNFGELLRHGYNADTGWVDIVFAMTTPGANFKARAGVGNNHTGGKVGFGGMQVYTGKSERPWVDTQLATVVNGADVLTVVPDSAVADFLEADTGWVGLEVADLDYALIGTGGVPGATTGQLLKCGATNVLKPKGPTAYTVTGSDGAHDARVGLGGFRGIVRVFLAWNGGKYFVAANGEASPEFDGAIDRTGAKRLLAGITGRVRLIEGGEAYPTRELGASWSSITNKTLTRPGNALAPGIMVPTFTDDFDVDSIQQIQAPAFPYPSGEALALGYKADALANPARKWRDRYFFHAGDPYGMGADQWINGEPQYYMAHVAGNPAVHTFANSRMRINLIKTSTLPPEQQARVPDRLDGTGQFPFVSGVATTFGFQAPGTGEFYQRHGLFSFRRRLTAFPGTWPAEWLYQEWDTSEGDVSEDYGINPTIHTTALHGFAEGGNTAFGWNDYRAVNLGFRWDQDDHTVEVIWKPSAPGSTVGVWRKYFDGALVADLATNVEFEKKPKMLLLNLAVQPAHYASNPGPLDVAASNGDAWAEWDWVKVYQFAS